MTKYQPSEAQAKEAILLTLLHKANWQFPCIPQLLQRWLLLWHISHLLLIGTRTRSSRSALCILALNHRHILLQKRMGTFFLPWNCCFSSKSKLLQGFAFWWKWQMLFFHKWHKEGLVLLVILKKKNSQTLLEKNNTPACSTVSLWPDAHHTQYKPWHYHDRTCASVNWSSKGFPSHINHISWSVMFHNSLLPHTTAYFMSYTNCPYILLSWFLQQKANPSFM